MNDRQEGFACNGMGFQITFANRVTVFVQLGSWDKPPETVSMVSVAIRSTTADTAVLGPDGEWLTRQFNPTANDVLNWQSPADVLELLKWAAAWKEEQQ